jgi:hypothetical protein
MKNLHELCCETCRDTVTAIEKRDQTSGEGFFAGSWEGQPAEFTARAVRDRRELLRMLEQLLGTVAAHRENWKLLEGRLGKLIAALPPPAEPVAPVPPT